MKVNKLSELSQVLSKEALATIMGGGNRKNRIASVPIMFYHHSKKIDLKKEIPVDLVVDLEGEHGSL